MGEVYRARDARLHRDVAIKILPRSFSLDEDRLRRFEREARILASLDHPHIAGIYGVEDLDASKALVLEFVEGPTLAERIERGPLDLHETLTIARQIADAVESAHEQGIIHRDLKPANIKVRSDGTVKVLDFGLARADALTDTEPLNAPTVTAVATKEGVVMGTAAYMSPEQARGRHVDRRTDIWAFGCILFEMLSGRRAFQADGSTDTIAKVLQSEPDWQILPAEIPRSIRDLLTRCLQKDQRQRLRDIGDARITIEEALAKPDHDEASDTPRGYRLAAPASLIAIALASAAITYGVTRLALGRPAEGNPAAFDHVVRLVASSAHEFSPAISPDGKWVAYLSNARGPSDIWLKSISGGDPINLTASIDLEVQTQDSIGGLAVSPDGTQIAFVGGARGTPSMSMSTFVLAAPLGGSPRRLLENAQGMRWSPDGKRIAYIRPGGSSGDSLLIADADGQNEREIVKREGARHLHWPQWSSDGRYVYFNFGYSTANAEGTEIFRVAVAGGPPVRVVATARRAVFPLASPDGRGLFFAGNPDSVDTNLWWRDFASGRNQRLTFGIGEYTSPSISADGRRLVAMVSDLRQSLQRVAIRFDPTAVLEPLTEGYTGDLDPQWSPDGTRLVFSSTRTGSRNIWVVNPDLSKPTALTTGDAVDQWPAYSPDGTQVAFVSDRGGRRGIWIVSAWGGSPRLITPAHVLNVITWSPDQKRLAYAVAGGEVPQLETVDVDSGKVTRLPTRLSANSPAWSPVEDVIAYVETTPGAGGFVRYMTGDGRPVVRGPADTVTLLNNGFVSWSPDGKRLAGIGLPGTFPGSIWILDPASPSAIRKLIDLPPDAFVRGASWSRDGSSLVIGHARSTGDIILAERLR
jgi:Tol biopolymer transport system component